MRRILKGFAVFSVIAMILTSFCMSASAAEEKSSSQDGLTATVISQKESYKANEDAELTFKVTNTNDYAVENVSLEAVLPKELKLKDNGKQSVDSVSLKSGESVTLDIVVVKEDNSTANTESTSKADTTKPTDEKTTENATTDNQSVTSVTESVTNGKNENNQNNKANDNNSVKTGSDTPMLFVGSICVISFALIMVLKNRKKAQKYLSILLCLSIVSGTAAIAGVSIANAAETTRKSFSVNKKLTIADNNYTIEGIVSYDYFVSDEKNISKAEWADMLVREFSMNTEIDQTAEVPYSDIKNNKYEKSISVAYYYGVLPTDSDKYSPNESVTREFAAYTLNNCLGFVSDKDFKCDDYKDLKYPDASAAMIERGFFELENNKFMPNDFVKTSELSNIIALIKKYLSKTEVDNNYDNTVETKDDVLVFDNDSVKTIGDNTVTLKSAGEAANLKEGDVFFAPDASDLNYPEAYKVTKVQKIDGNIVLTVTEPELYEVYKKIDVQGTIKADSNTDTYKLKKSAGDNSVGSGWFEDKKIDVSDSMKLDADKLKFKNKTFKIGEGANTVSVTLNGGLESPELEYRFYAEPELFTLNPLHIKDNFIFYAALKNKLSFSGTVKVAGGIGKDGTVEIAKYPVRILPTIGVNVSINLTVKADGTVKFDVSVENTVGVLCDKEGLQLKKDFSKPQVNAEATVNGTLGIGPSVEITAAGITLGVNAEIGAKAKINVSLIPYKDNLLHGDIGAYFYFNCGVYTGDALKELLEFFKVPSKCDFEIVKEENSPIKISAHMEGMDDIRLMDKCTYRYVSGTVTDKKTLLPVSNAKVEIYSKNTDGSPISTVATNDFGKFESLISNVDGDFVFVISKDGYATSKNDVKASKIKRGKDTDLGKFEISTSSSGGEVDDRTYHSNLIQEYQGQVYYSTNKVNDHPSYPRLDFSKVKPEYKPLNVKTENGVQSFIIYDNKVYYICNFNVKTGTKGIYTAGDLYSSNLDGSNAKRISADVNNMCMEISKGVLYFNTGKNYDEIIYNRYNIENGKVEKINTYESVGVFELGSLFRYEQSMNQYMEFDGGLYYYAREGILETINGERANVYYYRKDKVTGKISRVGYSYSEVIATDSYKDKLIDELLENESDWFYNTGATVGYHSALTFKDLNFDGRPEFLMECGGGSMRNNPVNVYYYSQNKLQKANGSFDGNIKGYYIKQTGEYCIQGKSYCRETDQDWWIGNYGLQFTGTDVSVSYYSSMLSENSQIKYFKSANSYGNSDGCAEISKDEYELINTQELGSLVDVNMRSDSILAEDWVKLSKSEKRATLEKLYDSFTYDKY